MPSGADYHDFEPIYLKTFFLTVHIKKKLINGFENFL